MDRRDTDRRGHRERPQRGSSGRKSRAGLASGIPGTHPDGPEPGLGFAVPAPSRTVSAAATEQATPVDPEVGFAVPAPTRLATTTLEMEPHGRHEAPVRHRFLTNRLRQVPGTGRFGLAAGQVLVVIVICMLVWTLLSAHSLHRAAQASPDGARRSASLTVLGPVDAFTHALFIDRLASIFQGAVGRDPDSTSPGGLADQPVGAPPTQPTFSPAPTEPRTHPTPTGPRGNGGHHGGGNGSHPSPKPTGKHTGGTGATLPPLRVPTAANPLRVLVVGDSFSQDVEIGLSPVTNSTYFRIIEKGLQSTGLSRPDYYNWPDALEVFVQQYHPDIVLIMLGGNDPQTLHTLSGGKIPFGVGDPRWPRLYTGRVDQMMKIASSGGAHVAWIGMPIMGSSEAYSRNIEFLDSIYTAEARKHPGVLYLDTWDLFTDKKGNYADYLPDKHGNLQLVRASDKIHLSGDGNRILTTALIRAMKFHAGWHLSSRALG